MDSGPVCGQERVRIDGSDDARSLRAKLIDAGLGVLERTLTDVAAGVIRRDPQRGDPTFAPTIKKGDGAIDWSKSAAEIRGRVAGLVEWPGASTAYRPAGGPERRIKIFRAAVEDGAGPAPGTIVEARKNAGLLVQAGSGRVLLQEVQPEGKKVMDAWAFWQGAHMAVGDAFR